MLKKLVILILTLYICFCITCKKSTPTQPEPPVQVTLSFDVYNHTQGLLTNFSRTVTSGEQTTIKISELGVSGVDDKRIVIRRDNFGDFVASNLTDGEVSLWVPNENRDYDIYLFNALNGAPYDCMDEQNAGLLNGIRYFVVNRRDFNNQTGPEKVWGGQSLPEINNKYGVFDQLHQAINYPWASYGTISRQPNESKADFSYGYGDSYGNAGWHNGDWITVNTIKVKHILGQVSVGLEEAFENITFTQNICGRPSGMTILFQGELLDKGADLFAYAFVKDDY